MDPTAGPARRAGSSQFLKQFSSPFQGWGWAKHVGGHAGVESKSLEWSGESARTAYEEMPAFLSFEYTASHLMSVTFDPFCPRSNAGLGTSI